MLGTVRISMYVWTKKVGKKKFETFLLEKLVEGKKSYFQPFCKANLITENKRKKKFLKSLSVVKEVCRAFGVLVNKEVQFT